MLSEDLVTDACFRPLKSAVFAPVYCYRHAVLPLLLCVRVPNITLQVSERKLFGLHGDAVSRRQRTRRYG
jgi:hypothetical protein